MAPRKCTQARRAGEGARRGGHSPAGPRPGGPREALGPLRLGWGSRCSGGSLALPSASFLLRPFHVGPRAAGHVGGREPGRASARLPGVALAPSGPCQARGADLPPSRPRGSNFLLGPGAGRSCLLRPAGSGAGRPQGALALPKSGSGRLPAPGPRGGGGCGCASPVCWNLERLCSLQEAKHFLHIKKKKRSFLLPGSRRSYF